MRSKAGCFKNQPSQPQTFEDNVTDSPVGLLACIYGKLVNWSDSYSWEDDEGTWCSSTMPLTPSLNCCKTQCLLGFRSIGSRPLDPRLL